MTAEEQIMVKKMDEKLRELLSPEEYMRFSTDVAKEMLSFSTDTLPESTFKNYCKNNFSKFTE